MGLVSQYVLQARKKRGERGPTELKKFWNKYRPHHKIKLTFNHLGEPCGPKACKLANFIGYLVKGKDVSMAATDWRKVPKAEKEKLWDSIKGFFIVDESFKEWVMKSAGKKFRGFKAFLKRKHYDHARTIKENIENGCNNRIPPTQWARLVNGWATEESKAISIRNKNTRVDQENGTHTAGTRSFAVKHKKMEYKEGRRVGRVELFFATHLNSKGHPVSEYAASKMREVKDTLEDPTMTISDDEALYAKVFPRAKKSTTHGSGLVMGGRTAQKINHLMTVLHHAEEENNQLRGLVQNLVAKSEETEKENLQLRGVVQSLVVTTKQLEDRMNDFMQSYSNRAHNADQLAFTNQQYLPAQHPHPTPQEKQQQSSEATAAQKQQPHPHPTPQEKQHQGSEATATQKQQPHPHQTTQGQQHQGSEAIPPQQKQQQPNPRPQEQQHQGSEAIPPQQKQQQPNPRPQEQQHQGFEAIPPQQKQQQPRPRPQERKQQGSEAIPPLQKQQQPRPRPQERKQQGSEAIPPLQKQQGPELIPPQKKQPHPNPTEQQSSNYNIYANTRKKMRKEEETAAGTLKQIDDSQIQVPKSEAHVKQNSRKRKREEENEHAEFKRLFTWKHQESETQQTYKEELPSSQVKTLVGSQGSASKSNIKQQIPTNAVKSGQLGKRKEVPRTNNQDSQVKSQKKEELIKVKLEKVTENKAARAKQGKTEGKKKTENRGGTIILKKGMEVGLTSPNSAQIVGYGTLQNVDKDAKCTDGMPLCDYVEVLVNIVLKETTLLPRALGRITNLGNATAHCIPWPRKNLEDSEAESMHSTIEQIKEKTKAQAK